MRALRLAFRLGASRALQARTALAVSLAFYALILVIFAAVWRAATAGDGTLVGYTFVALAWYTMGAEAAVIPARQRMIDEIGTDIGSGAIEIEMLRPIRVASLRLAAELGEASVRYAGTLVVGTAAILLLAGRPPSLLAVLLAVPAGALAISCNIAAQHAFAASAFWLRDAKSGWMIYQKFVFLLGGMLLPLQVLPDAATSVAFVLPFWTMAYAPARIMSGHVEPLLLVGQIAWLIALVAFTLWLFSRGERRITAGKL